MNALRFRATNQRDLSRALELLTLAAWEVSSATKGMVTPEGEQPTPEQCRNIILGMVDEVTELLREMDWKPWKVRRDVDISAITEEAADILVFFGMIMTILAGYNIQPWQVALAYLNKMEHVRARLAGEVDGYIPRPE